MVMFAGVASNICGWFEARRPSEGRRRPSTRDNTNKHQKFRAPKPPTAAVVARVSANLVLHLPFPSSVNMPLRSETIPDGIIRLNKLVAKLNAAPKLHLPGVKALRISFSGQTMNHIGAR